MRARGVRSHAPRSRRGTQAHRSAREGRSSERAGHRRWGGCAHPGTLGAASRRRARSRVFVARPAASRPRSSRRRRSAHRAPQPRRPAARRPPSSRRSRQERPGRLVARAHLSGVRRQQSEWSSTRAANRAEVPLVQREQSRTRYRSASTTIEASARPISSFAYFAIIRSAVPPRRHRMTRADRPRVRSRRAVLAPRPGPRD